MDIDPTITSSLTEMCQLLLTASNSLTAEALVTRKPNTFRAALSLAITAFHQSEGHCSLPPSAYHHISRLRYEHYNITHNVHHLLEAIAQLEASAASPLPHTLEAMLSDCYTKLFSLKNSPQLTFAAIGHEYLVLQRNRQEHPSYRERLQLLALSHYQRSRGNAVVVGDEKLNPDQHLDLAIQLAGAALSMGEKPEESRRDVLEAITIYMGKGVTERLLVIDDEEVDICETEEDEEDVDQLCHSLRIMLAIYHKERYLLRNYATDLEMCITYSQEAQTDDDESNSNDNSNCGTPPVPDGPPNKSQPQTRSLDDLTREIELITAEMNSIPSSHPDTPKYMWCLSRWHKERYKRLSSENDLHSALEYALTLTTEATDRLEEVPRADLLVYTAVLLDKRFELNGERGDIDTAVKMCRDGLELARATGVGHRKGDWLRLLLHKRFCRFGDMADLDSAIDAAETELSKLIPGSNEHVRLQTELREYNYEKRNQWGPTSRPTGEEDYRKLQQEAKDPAGSRDPDFLRGLALEFYDHWLNTYDHEALHMAVKLGRSAAVEIEAEGGERHYPMFFGNMSTYLEAQFRCLNSLDILEEAIEFSARQMSLTPDEPRALLDLATRLVRSYAHTNTEFDLEAAIATCTAADARAPAPHVLRPHVLQVFSTALVQRYNRTGDPADLEWAITTAQEALDLTAQGESARPSLTLGLAELIGRRYDDTNVLRDLHLAMELAEDAAKACSPNRADYSWFLSNLGQCHIKRYLRLRTLEDLQSAKSLIENALSHMKTGDPGHTETVFALNKIYLYMHGETNDPAHLTKAIEMNELCAETIPPSDLFQADLSRMLSKARLALYKNHGYNSGDLALAIESAEMAVRASLPTQGAGAQMMLGDCLAATSTQQATSRAAWAYIQGWQSVLSPPMERMDCASAASGLLGMTGMWEVASKLADAAIMLLPKVNSRSLERVDQQEVLGSTAGNGAAAASLAIQAGRGAGHALRMLELGRGVMLGYTIDNRSDISDLRRSHPMLADKFEGLRRVLDTPAREEWPGQAVTPIAAAAERRHYGVPRRQKLVKDMDSVLEEIRGMKGYQGFLLPPGEQEMMKLAESGPVVVVNPGFRFDAIIITTTDIKSIALAKLNNEGPTSVNSRLQEMRGLTEGPVRTYAARNKKMGAFLLWLWEVVVEPILEELQIRPPSPEIESKTELLPHIWWIGVGILSTAPFHAAGDHSPKSNRNTISRVVSSYIPTLKALAHARQKTPPTTSLIDNDKSKIMEQGSQQSLLLITMPTTPGKGPLQEVATETANIAAIAKRAGAKTTVLLQPSPSLVLAQLQCCDAIHFACHGVADSKDPSKSALLLLSEDGKSIERLLVEDVAAIHLRRARLAYLSACSTADPGGAVGLEDETIHLAGAFQLAGFADVVATMWTSRDAACIQVAEEFYRGLYRIDGHGDVGRELHAAVRKLRGSGPGKYLQWAPFIHTGP